MGFDWELLKPLAFGGGKDALNKGKDALNKGKELLADKEIRPTPVDEPGYYPELRQAVGERLKGLVSAGPKGYEGSQVAPLSDYETQSLGKLSAYAGQGQPSIIGEGSAEVSKTLANQYDPETSAYYQAFRDTRMNELEQSKERLGEEYAGGPGFFHGGRLKETRELEEGATRDMNLQSAQLADQERNRQLSVLPEARAFGQTEEEQPLRQATALQSLGAKPREISQAEKTASYNEFMRTEGQTRDDLALSNQFAGDVPYAYSQYQESETMRLLKALISAGGQAAGAAAAGGACHVAEELYGVDDTRTHLARLFVATHESDFITAYRKHSRKWAAWLREHSDVKHMFQPIWDAMWMAQAKESLN